MKKKIVLIATLCITFATLQGLSSSASAQETKDSITSYLDKVFVELSQLPGFKLEPEDFFEDEDEKDMGTMECISQEYSEQNYDSLIKVLDKIPEVYLIEDKLSKNYDSGRLYMEFISENKANAIVVLVSKKANVPILIIHFSNIPSDLLIERE